MNNIKSIALISFLFLVLISTSNAIPENSIQKPDILLIIIDDFGFDNWNQSPVLIKLANESTVFNRMYHPESVCTPNRAALMTGKYPISIGMSHSATPFRVITSPYHPNGLPKTENTIGKLLSENSYASHYIGKWHLGIGEKCKYCPTNHGFKTYYGMPLTNIGACADENFLNPQVSHSSTITNNIHFKRLMFIYNQYIDDGLYLTPFRIAVVLFGCIIVISLRFKNCFFNLLTLWVAVAIGYLIYGSHYFLLNKHNCILMRGTEVVERPVDINMLTYHLTEEAVEIIRGEDINQPLFMVYASDKMHTAIGTHPDFYNITGKGLFSDGVMELDKSIGVLIENLKKRGNEYVVIILSDNGPHLEEGESAGDSHSLRGGKATAFEGGIRTKAIWNTKFGGKALINDPVSTLDILPTILDIIGNNSFELHGQSLLPLLSPSKLCSSLYPSSMCNLNLNQQYVQRPLFHYCGTKIHAITMGDLKAIFEMPKFEDPVNEICPAAKLCFCTGYKYDPPIIFNITEDIRESRPLKDFDPINFKSIIDDHNKKVKEIPSVLGYLPNPLINF